MYVLSSSVVVGLQHIITVPATGGKGIPMGVPMRGAAANNQQAKSMARVSKAKAAAAGSANRARHIQRFKLLVNQEPICSLTANAHTVSQMQHQIDTFSDAKVTFIGIRFDAGGNELELVTDRVVDDFVKDRLKVLGTQLK